MDRNQVSNLECNGLSIIIPAFNEEKNIAHAVLEAYNYCCRELKTVDLDFEILVINDGSRDNTPVIIDNLAKQYPLEIIAINNPINSGYGYSISKGIAKSKYNLIFFTDADRQFNIEDINLLLPLMLTGVPDIVIGYRLDRKDPPIRIFLSWGFNSLIKFIFDLNVKDIDCAFKLFKKEIFKKIDIESRNFFINTEILVKAIFFGFRILEIGIEHFPRQAGQSTVSLKYIPLTLIELFKIWRSVQRLKTGRIA